MTSAATLMRTDVDSYISAMAAISLADLTASAGLLERVDRKYVLTSDELTQLLQNLLGTVAVLEIDGDRHFQYESTYFDTPAYASYFGSAHRRPNRFKVRTRTYVEAGTSMLEVKTKGRRGITVKTRRPHALEKAHVLGADDRSFVDTVLQRSVSADLRPALTTSYQRTTLAGHDDVSRITIDSNLACVDQRNARVHLDGKYVVETKSTSAPCAADRVLWSLGRRPEKISKYGIGMAALNPELSCNKWHRTLQRHVHVDTTEVMS